VVSVPVVGLRNDTSPALEKAIVDPSGDQDGSEELAKLSITVPVAGSSTSSTGPEALTVASTSTTASQPPPGDSAAEAYV
jgi:hypothetical protein